MRVHMNSGADKIKASLNEIRKRYRELKREGNVDPFSLREDIKSFINAAKPEDESYEDLRQEAEDMLIDVTFIIKENCCSPLKEKCPE
jgi:DNA-binding transcriptional regulator YhcF (GntR family)